MNRGHDAPVKPPPALAQIVNVGPYPASVDQADMSSDTYCLDTCIWFCRKGDIDPTQRIKFINTVEEWGKRQETLKEEPKILSGGSKCQIMPTGGRCVRPLSLVNDPPDRQHLSAMIEGTTNGAEAVPYVIDRDGRGASDLRPWPP